MKNTMNKIQQLMLIGFVLLLILPGCNGSRTDPAGAIRYYGDKKQLEYDARLGGVLFQKYCAVCHGVAGKGDGFNAFNLTPRPRDLSDSTFQKSVADSQLVSIIKFGGTFRNGSRNMPAWGETLSEVQIHRLVSNIRQLVEVPSDSAK